MQEMTQVEIKCNWCKQAVRFNASKAGLAAWRNGMVIQEALPRLDADYREMLISGTCPECWNKMTGEIDEFA
jgi:hypothetical protein